jgi:hypothetical protein
VANKVKKDWLAEALEYFFTVPAWSGLSGLTRIILVWKSEESLASFPHEYKPEKYQRKTVIIT